MSLLRQCVKQILQLSLSRHRLLIQGPRSWSDPANPGVRKEIRPTAVLTFDDGPDPVHTPELLDELAKHQLQATFFVIGEKARKNPQLIRRIVDEGHELGNHTETHSDPQTTSPREFIAEIARTRKLLEDLTGQPCSLVRPPKGELNPGKCWRLWQRRETVVLWNRDPRDYRMQSAEEMRAWGARLTIQPGDVFLFHDNHPWARSALTFFTRWQQQEQGQLVHLADWLGWNSPQAAHSAECRSES